MNGRVYDYRLGRFLSVDPIISNPANSQSINPYSYIGNNPLSGKDPTGYMSVGTGCGDFSRCDVELVNPTSATLALYAPSNGWSNQARNGADRQGTQTSPAGNPSDTKNPAQNATGGEAAATGKPGEVLLAQAVPPRGGRRGRGGGPRPPELPPESIEEIVAGGNVRAAKERVEAAGGSTAEIRPPGPRTEEDVRYWEKAAEAAEAAQAARTPQAETARTKTDRYLQHLTTDDLVGAAREVRSGVPHGGQHLKEVSEAAGGLRIRMDQIQNGLANPNVRFERRIELMQELSKASKALDAAEQALQGNYPRHSQ
jgi:hypothetical protein